MLQPFKDALSETPFGQKLAKWKLQLEATFTAMPEAPPLAYRITSAGMEELRHVERSGSNLPRSLCIESGIYTAFGKTWDCSKPGVYRFCYPHRKNLQRVILDPASPSDSAMFLSYCVVRGNRDDFLSTGEASKVARETFLTMTCGPASEFVAHQLQKANIPCRVVGTQTQEKYNGYADGHIMVEAGENFDLFDIDANCRFKSDNQAPANLIDVCSILAEGRMPQIIPSNGPDMVDWGGFSGSMGYSFGFLEYLARADETGREAMYARVFATPYIRQGRDVFYTSLVAKVPPPNEGWKWLNPEDFKNKFYPKQG